MEEQSSSFSKGVLLRSRFRIVQGETFLVAEQQAWESRLDGRIFNHLFHELERLLGIRLGSDVRFV